MLIAVNYHYIRNSFETKYPSFFGITPPIFKNQLLVLKQFGEFISLLDVVDFLKMEKKMPQRAFIVTFDDGLREQYEFALPILEELGIPAIFFVNTRNIEENKVLNVHRIHLLRSEVPPIEMIKHIEVSLVENNINYIGESVRELGIAHYKYDDPTSAELKYLLNFVIPQSELDKMIDELFAKYFDESLINQSLYMDKKQINDLASKNMLGSHGHDHHPIAQLNPVDQESNIRKSSYFLQKLTGSTFPAFSYPYGSVEAVEGLEGILKANNFTFAFTMERAVNPDIISNPFRLSRFDNNDLPGGKSWKYEMQSPFDVYPQSKYQ